MYIIWALAFGVRGGVHLLANRSLLCSRRPILFLPQPIYDQGSVTGPDKCWLEPCQLGVSMTLKYTIAKPRL